MHRRPTSVLAVLLVAILALVGTSAPAGVKDAPASPLQRLAFEMKASVEALGGTIGSAHLERNAGIIYKSMSAPSRYFHSVQHVFDVSAGGDAVQTLAAFYHDTVYYQVDGGALTADQAEGLGDVIQVTSAGNVEIGSSIDANDEPVVQLVLRVFGYAPGKVLDPQAGMNEFLSAVLAARNLEGCLPLQTLLKIVACIEATIPFRPDVGPNLLSRLSATNDAFDLGLSADDIDDAVTKAVELANRDVIGFASSPQTFLAGTWNLMAEFNVYLRDAPSANYPYNVQDFSMAVSKMRKFLHFIQPENVFHRHGDFPPQADYVSLLQRTAHTLGIARTYMDCKLLCASFLGSLAVLTGGDCPVALFAFDRGDANNSSCLETPAALSELNAINEDGKMNKEVWEILSNSIGEEMVAFRISNTATASLLYGLIGDQGLEEALKYAAVPMDEENARRLLDCLPRKVVHQLVLAAAESVITRRRDLLRLAATYSPDPSAA